MQNAIFRYETDTRGNLVMPKGAKILRFSIKNPEALSPDSPVSLDELRLNVWALINPDEPAEEPSRVYPVRTGTMFPDDHQPCEAAALLVPNGPQVFMVAGPGHETTESLGGMFYAVRKEG